VHVLKLLLVVLPQTLMNVKLTMVVVISTLGATTHLETSLAYVKSDTMAMDSRVRVSLTSSV